MNYPLLQIDSTVLLYIGLGLAIAVVGYLVYRFFKSTEEKKSDMIPIIKRINPNPSSGPVAIEIAGKASLLKVLNPKKQVLGTFAITGGDVHFDFTKMPRGKYLVIANYGGAESNAAEFTLE